jgi:D-beta-D-heptose 7-phosphate kinase/D-beta-D-heptose 1-phosphate adenosyltransferase
MLDHSVYGDTARVSPEAPVPVVQVRGEDQRLGGAGNVAANLAGLGVQVRLLGVVGDDPEAQMVVDQARNLGIEPDLCVASGLATIRKTRIISRGQQLLRFDHEPQPTALAQAADAADLGAKLQSQLGHAHVLLLSDYAKGSLTAVRQYIQAAVNAGVLVVADPKQSDWRCYAGATVLTPNWAEFCATRKHWAQTRGSVEEDAQALRAWAGIQALVLTRGADGVSVYTADQPPLHIPAQALEVFDVTGAGDSFVATLAAALGAGLSMGQAAEIANIAGGLAVATPGTKALTRKELELALSEAGQGLPPILEGPALTAWVSGQRRLGRRIVMTNGCFDLLHWGHLECLRRARAEGDCLLLALNSDESVRRLKGPDRPVNSLAERLRMLQGIRDVDALAVFAQDTPQALIEEVTPDVLVKGGDYQPEDVVGAEHVQRHGGRVCIVPLAEGYSTTRLIEKVGRT